MTHRGKVYCITSNTRKPVLPVSLTHNGWSQWSLDTTNLLGFALGRWTSLNLSPLSDHAVVVQKSSGRFLCVGSEHSHQETDQVISIISLTTHSGTDVMLWNNLNLNATVQGLHLF